MKLFTHVQMYLWWIFKHNRFHIRYPRKLLSALKYMIIDIGRVLWAIIRILIILPIALGAYAFDKNVRGAVAAGYVKAHTKN